MNPEAGVSTCLWKRLRLQSKRAVSTAWSIGGICVGIAGLYAAASITGEPATNLPFISSIVLIFGTPTAPAARTRAVVGGHLVSGAVGILAFTVLGASEITTAIGVAFATAVMRVANVFHPPAALSAFLMTIQSAEHSYLFMIILAGAASIALFGHTWFAVGHRISATIAYYGKLMSAGTVAVSPRMPSQEFVRSSSRPIDCHSPSCWRHRLRITATRSSVTRRSKEGS